MSAPRRLLSTEGRIALGRLIELRAQQVEIEREIRAQVSRSRRRPADVSWTDIGGALDLTAQGAQQKYRDVAPKVRNRRPTPRELRDSS